MKQFLLLVAMTGMGGVGAVYHPFWAVLLYYTLAVLRPQFFWQWALPIEVRWSMIAAMILFMSTLLHLPSILARGKLNAIASLLLVYGVLMVSSCLTAYNPQVAQTWFIEYVKVLGLAIIATLIIEHAWQVRVMAVMILVVLGYIGWEVNYLYLFQGRLDIFHHGSGGLDNNGGGLLLAIGIPMAYAFVMAAPQVWQKGVAAAMGLCLMHAVMMSYSRGAMLAGTVGLLWILVHHRPRTHAVAGCVVLCLALSVLAGQEIRDRFMSTTNYQNEESAQQRFGSWSAAWQMIREHPIAGYGIRNSNEFSVNYGADRQGRTIHNQYLQIAADSGLPAMATYLAMLGTALVCLSRTRRSCMDYMERHPHGALTDPLIQQMQHIALGFQGSLLVFMLGGMFLSMELVELPWLLIMLAGLMPGAIERHLTQLEPHLSRKASPAVAGRIAPARSKGPILTPKGWVQA